MLTPGYKSGRWTVLEPAEPDDKGQRRWLCRCECGTTRRVLERSLKYKGSTSCGCLRKERTAQALSVDLTGRTFGELTVLKQIENTGKKKGTLWLCRCSCGAEYKVLGTLLITGRRTRCPSNAHDKNYAHVDIRGRKFECLTALYPAAKRAGCRSFLWHCRCDCGNEVDVPYNSLLYSNIKSCGCRKKAHDQKLKEHLTHVDGTSVDMIKSKKVPTDNTSGYRGVYFIRGKYVAKIVFQKKAYYLGSYDKIEQAAEARREAEEVIFDEVAAFYEKWNAKAQADPGWAQENPVKISVIKDAASGLRVTCLPAEVG